MLNGIDLSVVEGEVVVLIGASGSGKTSLLRCINLLNTPTSGSIVIGDEVLFHNEADGKGRSQIPGQEVNRIRSKTGMVFQQFNLFPHMTALENVMEGPVIVKKEPKEQARQTALKLLDSWGWRRMWRNIRASFPAASSSGSRSPGRWPCSPR